MKDKKALLVGFVLIVCVGIYFFERRSLFRESESDRNHVLEAESSNNEKENILFIDPPTLIQKMQFDNTITILDVRTKESFENEHIAHSQSISIGALEDLNFDQSKTLVIIVPESDQEIFETAKNILAKKSSPFFFLKGGITAWKDMSAPLISRADTGSFVDQSKITLIELEDFKNMQKEHLSSFFLIDIQTEENYRKRHIQGAINIPFSELEKRSSEIPSATSLLIYGGDNLLSFQGGVLLFNLGIFSAKTLHGNGYLSSSSGLILEP